MKDEILKIRPHHGMCLNFFRGEGYSGDFTEHMRRVKQRLEKNPCVRLTLSTDEICAACPNNRSGVCESEQKVRNYDRAVLEFCGLHDGEEIDFLSFDEAVRAKILKKGIREKICGKCCWNAICRDERQ
jgi:hypothetical protein